MSGHILNCDSLSNGGTGGNLRFLVLLDVTHTSWKVFESPLVFAIYSVLGST